ncbi:MAG: hypothetical protein UX65_C0005G0034 [Parcubacteria group bacterium GW2011_GWB1_46_8]|nr:MAG: hypothetical protein UX14_C0031G0006 [Parcubacteria group bacterium GW2011_GWF1_45_5]KKU44412.1 MAG: hypothetical protein UX61_C0001G0013 [Parcubacteria group bacterium GW2011_GWA2_46_7]KKU46328.1 MAG: hypothetical protein UX65_C0005G0034 [Parcubacteria group bacterium GW2011_GWB1_46_8]KKU47077.1 MAG: hypothetical protein UX66_C0026G0008 [Parcubacteria group bacterium GW2011_GWF2_46_8]
MPLRKEVRFIFASAGVYYGDMKIMIFTEGTIIAHSASRGRTRGEIVKQVISLNRSVREYSSYIPIGNSAEKVKMWANASAEIVYLTSRRQPNEVNEIEKVLKDHNFPDGRLLYRSGSEEYKDIAEKVVPDILIEDDCESIGGIEEMTITLVKPEIKTKIKSIPVKEFGRIDHLPDDLKNLYDF